MVVGEDGGVPARRKRTVALQLPASEADGALAPAAPGPRGGSIALERSPSGLRGDRAASVHWRRDKTLSSLSRMGTVSFMHGIAFLGGMGDEGDSGGDGETEGSGGTAVGGSVEEEEEAAMRVLNADGAAPSPRPGGAWPAQPLPWAATPEAGGACDTLVYATSTSERPGAGIGDDESTLHTCACACVW